MVWFDDDSSLHVKQSDSPGVNTEFLSVNLLCCECDGSGLMMVAG